MGKETGNVTNKQSKLNVKYERRGKEWNQWTHQKQMLYYSI